MKKIICPDCHGFCKKYREGNVITYRKCPVCSGRGYIIIENRPTTHATEKDGGAIEDIT